ncbi:MAG: lipase family protein [Thermoguttaceae bacterium]
MPSQPFSIPKAIGLGNCVLSAYAIIDPNDPAAFKLPPGYALVSNVYDDDITDDTADFNVFGFIAQAGTDVIVAIRGTVGVFEWIKDFEFGVVPFPYADAGYVENGFERFYATFRTGPSNTALRVVDCLSQLVSAGGIATLRIAGHSLGGALATMLALDVAANLPAFGALGPVVYTYGSPRVGDKQFAGAYDNLIQTSWRIANASDVVPQLPPQWAGYAHVDAELPINSDDSTKFSISCWHDLQTYLHTLDNNQPLLQGCACC